jgi:multidrug efflux pump
VFFVVIRGFFKGSERQRKKYAHEEENTPAVEEKI